MEYSGFFNANELADGSFDRTYLADSFADYFSTFIGNGVFANNLGALSVVVNNATTRQIIVNTGRAFINGYWYYNNAAILDKTIDAASTSTATRADAVILRLDVVARTISCLVIKGDEDASGSLNLVTPAIVRDGLYYDLRLASVIVQGSQILSIQDRRGVQPECGFVIGTVQQLDTTGFVDQLQGFLDGYTAQAETDYQNLYIDVLDTKTSAAQDSLNEFNSWIADKQNETTTDINALKTNAQSDWTDFQTQAQSLIDGGQTSIQQQLEDFGTWVDQQKTTGTSRLQELVDELEAIIDTGDISTIIPRIEALESGQTSISGTLTAIQNTLTGIQNTIGTLATQSDLTTGLATKMSKLSGATFGNNVVAGNNGEVIDAGKVSMNVGDAVGGNLTGTLPNPNLADIAVSQPSATSNPLAWSETFTTHQVMVNSKGQTTQRLTYNNTMPANPVVVLADEAAAQADMTGRLACFAE